MLTAKSGPAGPQVRSSAATTPSHRLIGSPTCRDRLEIEFPDSPRGPPEPRVPKAPLEIRTVAGSAVRGARGLLPDLCALARDPPRPPCARRCSTAGGTRRWRPEGAGRAGSVAIPPWERPPNPPEPGVGLSERGALGDLGRAPSPAAPPRACALLAELGRQSSAGLGSQVWKQNESVRRVLGARVGLCSAPPREFQVQIRVWDDQETRSPDPAG